MGKERLGWIDLAKVISICLVTSYHTAPPLTGYAALLVQLLRMPAFFLIAGFLFDEQKFPSLTALLKHRAKQLLIPYACFETILIPATCRSWDEMLDAVRNALLGHPTVCMPLWFLVCLFGMQVIHYLGIKVLDRLTNGHWQRYRYWLLGTYIVICTLLSPLDLPQHFQLNAIVINLPFYAAANCCKDWVREIQWRHKTTIAACAIGGLLLVWAKSQWPCYLLHLSAGLLLLPPYIATCKVMGRWSRKLPLVEYLGSNTIVILALHNYFVLAITKGLELAIGHDLLPQHGWLNPILTIVVVLCHYPGIKAINAWTPWLLGRARRSGGQ